jgi:hypothetical protein
MEWFGTGFVLTIGGLRLRLRLRIALEDVPCACHGKAAAAVREVRPHEQSVRRTYRVHPR